MGAERPDTLVMFLLYYSRGSWMINLNYVIYRKMEISTMLFIEKLISGAVLK